MIKTLGLLTLAVAMTVETHAAEIFADYFDIARGSGPGTEVMGKVNLKRNKDYQTDPVPTTYRFALAGDTSGPFRLTTEFDNKGRIFGTLRVAPATVLPDQDQDFMLTVTLNDGGKVLASREITVHVREQTLWSQWVVNYLPMTTEITKLYGRFKYSDEELAATIDELIQNNGRFAFSSMYGAHPADYGSLKEKGKMTSSEKNTIRMKGIEGDWKNVLKHIGGLGYAFAHSEEYGLPSNDPVKQERLKKAIYLSAYEFMRNVGVEGDAVLIDGNPIGPYLGDGLVNLSDHNLLSHQVATHQWEMTDPLASPLAHIMPLLLEDKAAGDPLAIALFNEIRDYFQLFFAEVRHRRAMDNKTERWREIQNEKYSNGAWADANIGHRWRCLMLISIIFADYNQPITYVPYWYDDFFDGTEFEGKTYAKNFSPQGVISDLRALSKLFSVPSFEYAQSGFNPDGSISHHCDEASDVVMYDYGFHWLVNPLSEARFWENTAKPIDIDALQFIADRYNSVYSTIIFKNRLDFTVIGRSHLANTKKFIETEFLHDGETLLSLVPEGEQMEGKEEMEKFLKDIQTGSHRMDISKAYWNADFVLHRKESGADNYYFSVKNKSVRTIGAEDFSDVRKSWHFGSGVFQLKVAGDEYAQIRLNKWDHHTVPGVTEEWRNDPLPTGHSAASKPGLNRFSGQLADGAHAMAAYHHMPRDEYATANALKSYFMAGNMGTAVGTDVRRAKDGEGENIVTTVDQLYFDSPITYFDGRKIHVLQPDESHDITLDPGRSVWIHHGEKGYLIFPQPGQKIFIRTNDKVNVTNPAEQTYIKHYTGHYYLPSPEFGTAIIAIDHGRNPKQGRQDQYHYALLANVSANEIPEMLDAYATSKEVQTESGVHHAVHHTKDSLTQIAFFEPSKMELTDRQWWSSDHPALVMVKQQDDRIGLSVSNPLHTLDKKQLVLETSLQLKPGSYPYLLQGIMKQPGENFIVTRIGSGSRIIVELPDRSDAERYNHQEMMYAGSPLCVSIPAD